jgi:carbonic anhydrase/acetyltransferase-like protein (isoleucine patch superfamily)
MEKDTEIGPFYSFEGHTPSIHPTAFVHPSASVIGRVWIGKDVFIGPGAVLRGDFGRIEVEAGANIQDNCVVHMFPGDTVRISEGAHIGHAAVVHGALVGKNVLIGMSSVLMDKVEVGDESIVGALSFVPTGMKIPSRKLLLGNPARIIKDVSPEMLEWKTLGTLLYQKLPAACQQSLSSVPPRIMESNPGFSLDHGLADTEYKIWKESQSKTDNN